MSEKLYERVSQILEEARRGVARAVNAEMVQAYWLIGREIVEEELRGEARAGYGEALVQGIWMNGRHWREHDLEQAIIDRLGDFLLELGKGLCFVARQK